MGPHQCPETLIGRIVGLRHVISKGVERADQRIAAAAHLLFPLGFPLFGLHVCGQAAMPAQATIHLQLQAWRVPFNLQTSSSHPGEHDL